MTDLAPFLAAWLAIILILYGIWDCFHRLFDARQVAREARWRAERERQGALLDAGAALAACRQMERDRHIREHLDRVESGELAEALGGLGGEQQDTLDAELREDAQVAWLEACWALPPAADGPGLAA
jgi:hypothetical protein